MRLSKISFSVLFMSLVLLFQQPVFSSPVGSTLTAYWTGKSKMVTTVTGKSAIRCEYSYYGSNGRQVFTQLFEGYSCPTSIEVY